MAIDARPVTIRPHPSHTGDKTEGTSSMLAKDAPAELPDEPDDLELPSDFELQIDLQSDAQSAGDDAAFEDDIDGQRDDPEVEDTPGDDALIAQARIDRFGSAHDNTQPVDVGPFKEQDGNANSDDS